MAKSAAGDGPLRLVGGGERRGSRRHMRAADPGADCGWRRLRVEELISRAMREERIERHRVEPMSGAIGPVEADNGRARERQIADRIERLVAHELIGVAEPFRVEDGVAIDGDRILERGAERIAGPPQGLNVADESERARAGDVAPESRRIKIEHPALAANRRRFEVDLDVEAEAAFRGDEFGEAALMIHAHRLDDLEIAARPALLDDANRIDRPDKVDGGAAPDRRLRAI